MAADIADHLSYKTKQNKIEDKKYKKTCFLDLPVGIREMRKIADFLKISFCWFHFFSFSMAVHFIFQILKIDHSIKSGLKILFKPM